MGAELRRSIGSGILTPPKFESPETPILHNDDIRNSVVGIRTTQVATTLCLSSVNWKMSLSSPKSAPESRPCPSCHHPPSYGRPTAALSSLDALLKGAESGCLSCSVLSAGIKSIIGDDVSTETHSHDSVGWLRMDMGMGVSGKSLNLTLFYRELEITAFAPPGLSEI